MKRASVARTLAAVLPAAGVLGLLVEDAVVTEDDVPAITENALMGQWRKVTQEACATRYPVRLDLRPGGIYDAPGAPDAGAYWHGGEWELAEDRRIVVQVANDAMVSYSLVEISETELTLEDADGCQVTYRREDG